MLIKKEAEKIGTLIAKLNALNYSSKHAAIKKACDRAALDLIAARNSVTTGSDLVPQDAAETAGA
jgi:hypothetical protein